MAWNDFNYDGVGRLYRTTSRLNPGDLGEGYSYAGAGVSPNAIVNRSERFFYDGTRRVQEVVTDPIVVTNEDGDVSTMGEENQQRGGNEGGASQLPGAQLTISYLRATYIWGPGDSPTSGVDELLVQIDPSLTTGGVGSDPNLGGKPWYAVNDAQGDLVALLHHRASTNAIEIAAQWTYSPYGEVLTYEQFHPHPAVVFGHKSLALDRLDAPALSWDTGTSSLSDTQRLMPGATLIAYARNRTYAPGLGRWLQQDPNASGQGVLGSTETHGTPPTCFAREAAIESRIADGLSLFGYTAANPVNRRDPSGLYSGSDFVEDFYDSSFSIPGPSDFITGMLSSLVTTYAANQEWDVDWAGDWSAGDDWHTKNDNSWITEALVMGVYESFEVGWGDYKINLLGPTASAGGGFDPGSSEGSQNVMKKSTQDHHIATNKGSYKADFERVFNKANMTLEDADNKVRIPHGGKHSREYKEYVLNKLRKAVANKGPIEAEASLRAELKSLKEFIAKNPHFVYNSAGVKPTGWKGMREMHVKKYKGKYRIR